MKTGAFAYSLHRTSPHVVQVEVRPLDASHSAKELMSTITDSFKAHHEYYTAGVLHGDVSIANVCIFEGKDDAGELLKAGGMLALEQCNSYQRFIPAEKSFECDTEADID